MAHTIIEALHRCPYPAKQQLLELIDCYQRGRLSDAQKLAERITKKFPKNTSAWKILSTVYGKNGLKLEAISAAKKAAELSPKDFEAHNNLGILLMELGKINEAEISFKQALLLKPDFVEAHNNLGISLQKQDKLQDAEESFTRVTALKPDLAEAHRNLAATLQKLGKFDASIASYIQTLKLNPNYSEALLDFGNAMMKARFKSSATHLYPFLIKLITNGNLVRPSSMACSILSLLRHDPKINGLLNNATGLENPKQLLSAVQMLHGKPLLHHLMRLCPLPDLQFERLFVSMRKASLRELKNINENAEAINFLSTLSIHCFLNEYVYSETEEEAELIRVLENKITEAIKVSAQIRLVEVLVLAAYRPLCAYDWCEKLEILNPLAEVTMRLITEPLSEKMLAREISRKGQISDKISLKVKSQYEENPYPRWVKPAIPLKKKRIIDICDEINLKLYSKNIRNVSKPTLLIAGCGTGQHSTETALRFANCKVDAVDLSLASLCYAVRKSNELRIDNLEYLQADILDIQDYGKKFDIIETVGVLHHMDDPMSGWSVLTNLLKQGGLMKVGLYSKLGRSHITRIRSRIAALNIGANNQEIKNFRSSLIELNKKEDQKVIKTGDFFSTSTLRDAIFHVKEHCFTIPGIEDCLDKLGLKFCGFEGQDLITRFTRTYGEGADIHDTDLWHKLEKKEPDTFENMYQFWCQKV